MIDQKSGANEAVRTHARGQSRPRAAFTLIELLVVIVIIVIVSAVALPTILPALAHRQVSEAARILQAVLAGARDAAIRDNAPSGIRLLPDPTFSGINSSTNLLDKRLPLAYNRIIPISPAPEYQEGLVSINPYSINYVANYAAMFTNQPSNVLVLEEATGNWQPTGTGWVYVPSPPTSWFWNIRVGDRIQLTNSGPWYTVIGPLTVNPATNGENPELFVNVGMPGATNPLSYTITAPDGTTTYTNSPEFLLLVNGVDDNGNGWIDEEWDNVDNDNDGSIDNSTEWVEQEHWQGSLATVQNPNMTYTIQRRPAPSVNAREVILPSDVVIDATSWGISNERTRVPIAAFNKYSGSIDVLVNPDGSVIPVTGYSAPTSLTMDGAFFHFWLAERSDVYPVPTDSKGNIQTLMSSFGVTGNYPFYLPMPLGSDIARNSGAAVPNPYDALVAANPALPYLKGELRIVTLFTRTGQTTTNDSPTFSVSNVNQPFLEAQRGISGGQQ